MRIFCSRLRLLLALAAIVLFTSAICGSRTGAIIHSFSTTPGYSLAVDGRGPLRIGRLWGRRIPGAEYSATVQTRLRLIVNP
jgi:hypothetical protein